MTVDSSFTARNRTATARIRDLAARLSDDDLRHPVGEHWTVSVALAHIAFWDRRVLLALEKSERDGKLMTPPIDIIVNDMALPLWAAIPPREAARLAIKTANELDRRLESLSPALLEAAYQINERWVVRAIHRDEHLSEIEAALKA